MSAVKGKKLRDIIEYMDAISDIIIMQTDAYLLSSPDANKEEEIYSGSVLHVPWYITDFYLANDSNGEAIGVTFNEDKQPSFIVYVAEDLERIGG